MEEFYEQLGELDNYIDRNLRDGEGHYNKANLIFSYFQENFFDIGEEQDEQLNDVFESASLAIKCSPGLSGAYYLRGMVYKIQGETDAAQCDLEQAVMHNSTHHEAIRQLVYLYIIDKDYKRALEYANRNIEAELKQGEDYRLRGLTMGLLKRNEEMEADYQQALALQSDSAAIHLARAAVAFVQRDVEKSEQEIKDGIAQEMTNLTYYEAQAAFLEKLGNTVAACTVRIHMLETNVVVYTDSHCAALYYKRGVQYVEYNRLYLALSDFDTAEGYSPNDAKIYFQRGLIHKKMKEYKKALVDLRKVVMLEELTYIGKQAQMYIVDIRRELGEDNSILGDLRDFFLN